MRNINHKLSKYIPYLRSSYSMQDLNYVEIIFYDRKIYVPQSLRRCVLDWYYFYLNHSGGSRLTKTTQYVCYWKGLVMQAELFAKT